MTSIGVAFILSFLAALLLTPQVLKFSLRHKLYDQPGFRKVHKKAIPRLGGIAVVLAFYLPLAGLLFVDAGINRSFLAHPLEVWGLFIGGAIIVGLGIYDDVVGAGAKEKLLVQVFVAILMWAMGYRIDILSNPFGETLTLGMFGLPVTILWLVGVMNAVNLIDGLDGLAGGLSLIAVSTLLVLAVLDNHVLIALISSCLAGALLGFLFFNFNPAKIFLGDTGSLFLGFVLGIFSITSSFKGSTAIVIAVPFLILALPIADTAFAILRRILGRRPIFSADQDHIHHRLLRMGFSHRGAVLLLYMIAAFYSAFAILTRFVSEKASGFFLLSGILLLGLFLLFLSKSCGRRLKNGEKAPNGKRSKEAFGADQRLERAKSKEELEAVLASMTEDIQGSGIVLRGKDGEPLFYFAPLEAEVMHQVSLLAWSLPPSGAKLEVFFDAEEPSLQEELRLYWEPKLNTLSGALQKWPSQPLQNPVPKVTYRPLLEAERSAETALSDLSLSL